MVACCAQGSQNVRLHLFSLVLSALMSLISVSVFSAEDTRTPIYGKFFKRDDLGTDFDRFFLAAVVTAAFPLRLGSLVQAYVVAHRTAAYKAHPDEAYAGVQNPDEMVYRYRATEIILYAGIAPAVCDILRPLLERAGNSLTNSTHLKERAPLHVNST